MSQSASLRQWTLFLCKNSNLKSSTQLCACKGARLIPHQAYSTSTENLPRVAQPSIWTSIIPKAFRQRQKKDVSTKSPRSKEWNPATFFICIFLLIGSNSIQMLTLRNEYESFNRKADKKIAALKEVLDKMQRGEKVDVEKAFGTGDPEQEKEWEDIIENIKEDDHLWAAKDRRREKRRLRKEQKAAGDQTEQESVETDAEPDLAQTGPASHEEKKPPSFY